MIRPALLLTLLTVLAAGCYPSETLLDVQRFDVQCGVNGAAIIADIEGDPEDLVRAQVEFSDQGGPPRWAVFLYPEEVEPGLLRVASGPYFEPMRQEPACTGLWTLTLLDYGGNQTVVRRLED